MLRLPPFRYHRPDTVQDAVGLLAEFGEAAIPVSGGTDLIPNMKHKLFTPAHLVALKGIGELKGIHEGDGELVIGAAETLTDVSLHPSVRLHFTALADAAGHVAGPQLRNSGTIGGNVCLDTRCTYYDQNYEWRKAIDFCMKKDGETCWVAPSSKRCLAVSSTDTAPALMSLGARVELVASGDRRTVALEDFYENDGIGYMLRRPNEILTEVRLEAAAGRRSTYWKLRRRGSFDFPVLSVAAAAKLTGKGGVEQARIVLGAVASRPLLCDAASTFLVGRELSDGVIAEAATLAARLAKPMDNTDFTLHWRKRVTAEFVTYALRELRGDDMREVRSRIARHSLDSAGC